ncbi:hypothetical protein [Fodinicola feengrottensis]|uniref:hypothetical protein n=1 Tax=Fodinicola feengrottensis TaxID=435914 RepID=UPI0031D21670
MPAYLSPTRITLITALVAMAIAVPLEVAGGVPGFPTIPPAIPISLVAALLIGVLRWKWAPILGLFVGLFMLVGFTLSGGYVRLPTAGTLLGTSGVWLYVLGFVVTILASIAALNQAFRRKTT